MPLSPAKGGFGRTWPNLTHTAVARSLCDNLDTALSVRCTQSVLQPHNTCRMTDATIREFECCLPTGWLVYSSFSFDCSSRQVANGLTGIVESARDGLNLQGDPDVLCKWAETWKMSFNIDKCKVLHYGKGNIEYKYSMSGQPLDEVDSEKDLGIIFSKNLKVAEQCKEAYTKANRMLGLVSRTVKYKNMESLLNLYKSLVRPHLDYCSSVWNPHLNKDKFLLERVQHRFTRMFPDLRKLPYEQRLSHLIAPVVAGRKTQQNCSN